MLAAGELRDRIVFERDTPTRNGFNEIVSAWSEYAKAWAKVTYGTGQERREAAQQAASAPATFRVRLNAATSGLTTQDRIAFNGLWDISSIVPFERDAFDITATRTSA